MKKLFLVIVLSSFTIAADKLPTSDCEWLLKNCDKNMIRSKETSIYPRKMQLSIVAISYMERYKICMKRKRLNNE